MLGHVVQDSAGRGTTALWDDVVALITPNQMTVALHDGQFVSTMNNGGWSAPIRQFRKDAVL